MTSSDRMVAKNVSRVPQSLQVNVIWCSFVVCMTGKVMPFPPESKKILFVDTAEK